MAPEANTPRAFVQYLKYEFSNLKDVPAVHSLAQYLDYHLDLDGVILPYDVYQTYGPFIAERRDQIDDWSIVDKGAGAYSLGYQVQKAITARLVSFFPCL